MDQGECDIRNYCRYSNKHRSSIFITLFTLWLFASLLLSKAFTGLLLNTFFYVNSIPVVTTLQDIRDNKQILVYGSIGYFKLIQRTNKFYLEDIINRTKNDREHFPSFKKTIENIVNGKAVILATSSTIKLATEMAMFYHDKLSVSKVKYFPEYLTFIVHRHREFTKIISF